VKARWRVPGIGTNSASRIACFAERRVLGLRVDPDQRQLEPGAGRFLDTKIRRGYCIAFEAGDEVNLTKQESNGLFVCLRRVGFGSDLCFWTLAAWLTEAAAWLTEAQL
jgi:hypothetical protein